MAVVEEPAAIQLGLEEPSTNFYELNPLTDLRWARLVAVHPHASVFHTTKWLQALATAYQYQPVVITTCSPRAPLSNGLVFCGIQSWITGRRLVSLPFSDHCEPLVSEPHEFDGLLRRAIQHAAENSYRYVEVRPISFTPDRGIGMGESFSYKLHSLDLRPSLKELFDNFHRDCVQRKIRRAEREGLRYQDGRSEELLQEFYRLLAQTRRRQFLPPQPLAWFRGLIAAFGNDLRIRLAFKDQRAVAGILTLSHRDSLVYKYGCSDAKFNRLGGMALLFWHAIQEAKHDGLLELEMGRSDVDNLGLIAFKERWGASARHISYWTNPAASSAGLQWFWKNRLAKHMVSTIPDSALQTIGRLLYRHIG